MPELDIASIVNVAYAAMVALLTFVVLYPFRKDIVLDMNFPSSSEGQEAIEALSR